MISQKVRRLLVLSYSSQKSTYKLNRFFWKPQKPPFGATLGPSDPSRVFFKNGALKLLLCDYLTSCKKKKKKKKKRKKWWANSEIMGCGQIDKQIKPKKDRKSKLSPNFSDSNILINYHQNLTSISYELAKWFIIWNNLILGHITINSSISQLVPNEIKHGGAFPIFRKRFSVDKMYILDLYHVEIFVDSQIVKQILSWLENNFLELCK